MRWLTVKKSLNVEIKNKIKVLKKDPHRTVLMEPARPERWIEEWRGFNSPNWHEIWSQRDSVAPRVLSIRGELH